MLRRFIKKAGSMRKRFENVIEVRVSEAAIIHNLNVFRSLTPGIAVAPVLKSNAYGHGLAIVG
ncbi:MAG: hypothetical protein B7W98_02415, partial [Parcubacteria group bacterium 20-58-5]